MALGAEPEMAAKARAAVGASLHVLDPEQDATTLGAGVFREIALFYAAFIWRGWVARA